jgi:hypothetical protein
MLWSDLKISRESAGCLEPTLVARTASALFDDLSVRPTPYLMADLIARGVDEDTILDAGALSGHQAPIMATTLQDLDASLAYFHMLSDKLARDFPDTTMLFAGRDAEALYDDFAIVHSDRAAHLMPASTGLWYSIGMCDKELASEFLAGFDLSGEQVANQSSRYVVVDSGFRGSIGLRLNEKVGDIHGKSIISTGQLAIKLVSAEADVKNRQIRDFQKINAFPELRRVQRVSQSDDRARLLAVEMQIMPRYHGAFTDIVERNGSIFARSYDQIIEQNIDRVMGVNASVVNPLAAAITQHRVVQAAMKRKTTGEVGLTSPDLPAMRKLTRFLLRQSSPGL